MPTVQIKDGRKYGKALSALLSMGSMFRSQHWRTFVIGFGQYQALARAGLVPPIQKQGAARGKKKKQA